MSDTSSEPQQAQVLVSDVESARQRDIQIIHTVGHNYRADFLAAMSVVMLAVCICLAFFRTLSESQERIVYLLIGVLSTIVVMVFSFEFGASQQDRTGDIKAQMDKLTAGKP